MDVEMTYAEPNVGSGDPLPEVAPQRLSDPSLETRGAVDLENVSGPSPTSSVTSFFSMDSDPDNKSGQVTPIARLDVEDHFSSDPLSHIPGMFRILDLIGEQSSGGIGKYHL
jgi:hypothetical protein